MQGVWRMMAVLKNLRSLAPDFSPVEKCAVRVEPLQRLIEVAQKPLKRLKLLTSFNTELKLDGNKRDRSASKT